MRLFVFLVLVCLSLFASWWLVVPAVFAYALWRPAYELVILGLLVDVQFGIGSAIFPYVYTVIFSVIVIGTELMKPYLSYYELEL